MDNRIDCSVCGGPFHPATGCYVSETFRRCGPCEKHFLKWLKGHLQRRWSKVSFYEHAATSNRPGDAVVTDKANSFVWVAEQGTGYDGRQVVGVYSTAEAAMASMPQSTQGKKYGPWGWDVVTSCYCRDQIPWDDWQQVSRWEVDKL